MHNKNICTFSSLPDDFENLLIADEDNPELKIQDRIFKRCLFIRLGLKSAEFKKVTFSQCIFQDCYLRKAKFYNVDFTGCFFIDCNLEKASFQPARLWYVRFLRCCLNYGEILQALPKEPSIAISLLKSIRQNAITMGDNTISDKLLMRELSIETNEFKNQFLGVSDYYKERYKGFDRLMSFFRFISNIVSNFWWGYGLRLHALFRSAFLIILVFTLIFFVSGSFKSFDSSQATLGFWESLYFSVATFTTLGHPQYAPDSLFCQAACAAESFLGVLFLGFFAASVYRKFSR